jgi:hypothetical protein
MILMISNAELHLASKGMVAGPKGPKEYELLECMRLEFPYRGKKELKSDIERATILLTDLHRVDVIARKAVDLAWEPHRQVTVGPVVCALDSCFVRGHVRFIVGSDDNCCAAERWCILPLACI